MRRARSKLAAASGNLESASAKAREAAGLQDGEGGGQDDKQNSKENSKTKCSLRNRLKKGGQMYCGYVTGE